MNQRFAFAAIVLGALVVLGSANSASAFFGRHGGGCCEPACGCDSGCGHRCCLFNLFSRHNDCCCEETCGCEASCGCAEEASCAAEPSCAAEASCAAEPSCGCEASCGCEESCCDPCCKPRRCCLFGCLGRLFHRHNSCCCEASCGCEAAPSCGCGG